MYLRDPILPVNELLNVNSEALDIKSYQNEMIKRAISAFRICKEFSEQKLQARNKSVNASREFKKIQPGSRIYVKNLIRTKLQPRFTGPYRVEGIKGSTVFCYDLVNGKAKQISMARCRNSESITSDEMPDLYSAYPNKQDLVESSDEIQNNVDSNKRSTPQNNTSISLDKNKDNGSANISNKKRGRPPKCLSQTNVIPRYNLRNTKK